MVRVPKQQAVNPVSPCPEPAHGIRYERKFWLGQLLAGLAGYLGMILVVAGYVTLTPSRAHRGGIVLLLSMAFAVAVVFFILRHRVVASQHRLAAFAASNIFAFLLLAGTSWLDGGISSPIIYLMVTAMAYLAIDYPLYAVLICGSTGLASYTVVAYASVRPLPVFDLMLQIVALGDIWALAIICSIFRDRKNLELLELRLELESRATTDSLTGCLNHRAFTQALECEAARCERTGQVVSVLLIDIDYFKMINDGHGHIVGDKVLRDMGGLLRGIAREADSVGRPGGDELGWLAPGADQAGALALAGRLRCVVAELDLPVRITLSIGIFTADAAVADGAELFRRADEALYRAKHNGRNRIVALSQSGKPVAAPGLEQAGGSVDTAQPEQTDCAERLDSVVPARRTGTAP